MNHVEYVVAKTNAETITIIEPMQFTAPALGWLVIDIDGNVDAQLIEVKGHMTEKANAIPYRRVST